MMLLTISGLWRRDKKHELVLFFQNTTEWEDAMPASAYNDLVNDVGDIFEAIAAIASIDAPKSVQVRRYLKMSDVEARRILALLASFAENMLLLTCRCNLTEQDIVKKLGLDVDGDVVSRQCVSAAEAQHFTPYSWQHHSPRDTASSSRRRPQPDESCDMDAVSAGSKRHEARVFEHHRDYNPGLHDAHMAHKAQHHDKPPDAPAMSPEVSAKSSEDKEETQPLDASTQSIAIVRVPAEVHDLRFHYEKKKKWIRCDHCSTDVVWANQTLPHDGDWLCLKVGVPISELRERWEKGENSLWYCIRCLTTMKGYGTDSHSLQQCRRDRGLLMHGHNRSARWAKLKATGKFWDWR